MNNKMIGMIVLALVAVAGAITFAAVRIIGKKPPATKIVFVVEATKSVLPEALSDGFKAVETGTEALERGDSLVVMPLTSDAANEVQGWTIRHRIPTERKAFDVDRDQVKKRIEAELRNLSERVIDKPFGRTDLIGTTKMVAEERPRGREERFEVVILSDFIQDTQDLNFNTDPSLIEPDSALKLAARIVGDRKEMFVGARVFLGQMRSEDQKRLTAGRRDAIRAFWMEFFRLSGAAEVIWATDGIGGLADFLRKRKEGRVK